MSEHVVPPRSKWSILMGNDHSTINDQFNGKYAFQVLRVEMNSPAFHAGFMPYFDYICTVNGVDIVSEVPNVVADLARNHIDRPLKMSVYNSRKNQIREVTVTPSHSWGGRTLLGAGIRFCPLSEVRDRSWHVIEVCVNSPAYVAGFIPEKDWIIGSPDIVVTTQEDMYNLLIHNQKRPVKLLVFNSDEDAVREVTVVPDFGWGGDGCVGFDVASGALHRIPEESQINKPPQTEVISELQ